MNIGCSSFGGPGIMHSTLPSCSTQRPGRRAVCVRKDVAALKAVGLLEVVRRHLAPDERETLENVALDPRVEHELLPEHLGDRLPGPVVARRPQAPRDDDDVGAGPALPKLRRNILGVIRYRHVPAQLDPARAELRPDERQVAVGRQPQQELVADRQQFKMEPVRRFVQTECLESGESMLCGR